MEGIPASAGGLETVDVSSPFQPKSDSLVPMAFGVPCCERAQCAHKPNTRGWCGHWAERRISLFSLLHHISSPWPLTAPIGFGGSCCRYLIENFPFCIGSLGLWDCYTHRQQYCMGFSMLYQLAQREEPGFECSYKEILNSPASQGCSPNTLIQQCSRELPHWASSSSQGLFFQQSQGDEHRSLQE